MTAVASRELRNNTRALLDRVDAGAVIAITVNGRAVAELRPIAPRRTWMTRAAFVRRIVPHQADPSLRTDRQELAPDLTDELPDR